MGKQIIKDTKHLNKLIAKAISESKYLSSNEFQSVQFESLSLEIHENYLASIHEQKKVNDSILSLQLKLEERISASEHYKDALIRLLIPQNFSLTLVYKTHGNIPYIKGRVYWDNKQREVQIGSIDNVMSQIKYLCKDGLMLPVKGIQKKDIKWKDIKANREIESAVQYVGKIKFRQYLLKHFKFPKDKSPPPQLLQTNFTASKTQDYSSTKEYTPNLVQSRNWYSLWRKDNL